MSLRHAAWLTPARVRAYGLLYALFALSIIWNTVVGLLGLGDLPPGDADFLSFHAAARLALAGEAALAWDRAAHALAQTAAQGAPGRYYAFFYPPTYLLICLPLGLMPLLPAFAAWVAATGAALWAGLRAWLPGARGMTLLLGLLAPAVVINALHGQNGFLAAALLAAAGLALERRPALAGAALATLAFKPQLGLLVIPALLAARRWAVLAWACAAGLAWIALSLLAFGPEAWWAFIARLPDAGAAMASGALAPWKLQSVQAMAITFGAPAPLAALLQAAVAAAAVGAVAWALRRRPGGRAEIAAVAAGAPLVTPFVQSYDMVVLLLPTAFLLAEARRAGAQPWERAGIAAAWLLPGLSLALGMTAGLGLGPLAPAILLALVLRRLLAP